MEVLIAEYEEKTRPWDLYVLKTMAKLQLTKELVSYEDERHRVVWEQPGEKPR